MEFSLLNEIISGTVGGLFKRQTGPTLRRDSHDKIFESFKAATKITTKTNLNPQPITAKTTYTNMFNQLKGSKDHTTLSMELKSLNQSYDHELSRDDVSRSFSIQGSLDYSTLEPVNSSFSKDSSSAFATLIRRVSAKEENIGYGARERTKSNPKDEKENKKPEPYFVNKEPDYSMKPRNEKNSLLDQWMTHEGPKRLNQSLKILGVRADSIENANLERKTLPELLSLKKKVKHELKEYDFSFNSIFKRQPEKREKEVMRPLYIFYKYVKNAIAQLEQKAAVTVEKTQPMQQKDTRLREQGSNTSNSSYNRTLENSNPKFSKKVQQSSSFSSGNREMLEIDKENNYLLANMKKTISGGGVSNGGTKESPYHRVKDEPTHTSKYQLMDNRKHEQQQRDMKNRKNDKKDLLEKRLEELRATRSRIKARLVAFNQEFKKNNNRKIRYTQDLQPVEADYKKFKELDAEIAQIQKILDLKPT